VDLRENAAAFFSGLSLFVLFPGAGGDDKSFNARAAISWLVSSSLSFFGAFRASVPFSSLSPSAFLFRLLLPGGDDSLSTMRFNVEFHLFLMALSVLPGNRFAISAHGLPSSV
jgi:hypothetical protein